jgi:hypothetical protein
MEDLRALAIVQAGLRLEDRQLLLPWGARLPQLVRGCRPTRLRHDIICDELVWTQATVFGGLRAAAVEVVLFPHGWLDSASIRLWRGSCSISAAERYTQAQAHLRALFGAPTCSSQARGTDDCLDSQAWEDHSCRIGLFLRAGRFNEPAYACTLHVAHR